MPIWTFLNTTLETDKNTVSILFVDQTGATQTVTITVGDAIQLQSCLTDDLSAE